jgi:AcrR family transcriptional regulator
MSQPAAHQSRRDQHAEERRNQLIDVALELFAEKGWENTSVKDLAEVGGVAPGLIYHYFSSKEDLLLAVFDKHSFMSDLGKLLAPATEQPASVVLLDVARAYYKLLSKKDPFVRMFLREAMTNPEFEKRWIDQCNMAVEMLSKYLDARVTAGELRPHNTHISARMLIHPIAILRLTGGGIEEVADLVQCLLEGIDR